MRWTKSWVNTVISKFSFQPGSIPWTVFIKISPSRAPRRGAIYFRPCITAPQRHLNSTSKEYHHEGNWCGGGRCTFSMFTIYILPWQAPHCSVIVASRQRQLFSHRDAYRNCTHTRAKAERQSDISKHFFYTWVPLWNYTSIEASPEIPSIISTYMYTNRPISSYIVFYCVVWRGAVVFTSYNMSWIVVSLSCRILHHIR